MLRSRPRTGLALLLAATLVVAASAILLLNPGDAGVDPPDAPSDSDRGESRLDARRARAARPSDQVAERARRVAQKAALQNRSGRHTGEFRPHPGRDLGLQLCDYWLARYDGEQGQSLASASVPRVDIDEAQHLPDLNPRRLTLTEAEESELARLLAGEDEAMNAASLQWKKAEWIAVKQKILAGSYVTAEGGQPAADAWAKAEQDALRAHGPGNFCLSSGPGPAAHLTRVYVLARGEAHGYLESLDRVKAVEQRRRAIIKEYLEGLRR